MGGGGPGSNRGPSDYKAEGFSCYAMGPPPKKSVTDYDGDCDGSQIALEQNGLTELNNRYLEGVGTGKVESIW